MPVFVPSPTAGVGNDVDRTRAAVIAQRESLRPTDPPPIAEAHEKLRIAAAIVQAKRRYPGVIAELIISELRDVMEFGWRFERGTRTYRLVEHLTKPDPAEQ